ncbi:acyltransferase [Reinekea marinisedimentorum]|uniref:Succinyltransferase-like protein n=1 Tax=Reinekea marinisedimentorum TaxID=230495 RepID=A0A4R3I923_9GAMM|nr:acyltransferase [Reinekea marinisedimentorum]TCS42378.1 succinyltransferase-like protein [Reinekea marinisedimentorum]
MTQANQYHSLRQTLKHSPAWWARAARKTVELARYGQLPTVAVIHKPLWVIHHAVRQGCQQLVQQCYFTPLFKSQLAAAPRRLQLYSGMPQLSGGLQLSIGEGSRISGISSFFGRSSAQAPVCRIGANVDIGWQSTIAAGRTVILEDNVRIAGRCYLAGFPGHPEDPAGRIAGQPETDDQVGDIVLKNNVWLATGVTVIAGVTIGENSIIAAGSVVTKDIPANVVAGGVPAKVLRPITKTTAEEGRADD